MGTSLILKIKIGVPLYMVSLRITAYSTTKALKKKKKIGQAFCVAVLCMLDLI